MDTQSVGIGVIGCGGFALFACGHFTKIPGVRVAAAADVVEAAAQRLAGEFGGAQVLSVEDLVQHPDVDIVYIATPPSLHYPQAMMALKAGKHVICEKPLAVTLEQADEMIAAARPRNRVLVANLMQRYNPLADMVKGLIDSQVLGEALHGYFENYAADESLGPSHWFWDPDVSGGIFIEHAVHFFDLFESWFGKGRMESAQLCMRPRTDIEDQHLCAVRYGDAMIVNFYHGFTQSDRMDRQEMRLLFERGDITLYEWVPTRARIRALVDEEGARKLADLFPDSRVTVDTDYFPEERACMGRHKKFQVRQRITLEHGLNVDKQERYGAIVRDMLEDQLAWMRDPGHVRRLTEQNGRDSLAMAVEANRLAHAGR